MWYTPKKEETLYSYLIDLYKVEIITKALKNNSGNQTHAAKELGISYRSIRHEIQKLKIDRKSIKCNQSIY